MNCTNCGAEIAPGAKFCVHCGQGITDTPTPEQQTEAPITEVSAPIEEAAAPDEETVVPAEESPAEDVSAPSEEPAAPDKLDVKAIKDELIATVAPIAQKLKPIFTNKKVLIGIAGVVALVLIIGIISAIASSNNGFIKLKQTTMAIHNGDDVSIIVDNKILSDSIESDGTPETVSSLNGKVTALLTSEGELYVVNGKKVVKVDEDVEDFRLSASGKGLAYVVEDDDDVLNLYTVSSKKKTTITDELYGSNFAISPDGKSVVYTVEDDDDVNVMFFKGKKSSEITSDDAVILGLSNNGKYIYLICENDDGESILYSYDKKGERVNLGDIDTDTVRFNDDHTQIMFYNDSKTYISNKGKDAEKAASDELRLVMAPTSQSFSSSYSTTYPVSSLFDHVYYGDDAWLLKKNAEKNVKLVSDVSSCSLDSSAKYLYYIHDYDELQVLQISKGEKAYSKAVTLTDDVANYVVTSDRKLVYYISDETLYSINGIKGGNARQISNDDVESYYLAINSKDVVYYVMDGDAYACSNGKKGTKVVSDAFALSGSQNGVVYIMTEDSLYATKTAKKLKSILTID